MCKLRLGICGNRSCETLFCVDVFLACGLGGVLCVNRALAAGVFLGLLCVNFVRGSCANRSCGNFALAFCWHARLAACCV